MTEKQKKPYGSWKSPITTDLMLSDSVGLGEIEYHDGSIYWIEMRPQEKGRYVIVKQDADGNKKDMIPQEYNARSRVHEYGGGSYLPTERGILFVNFSDQDIYLIEEDKLCRRLTKTPNYRYSDMIFDESRDRIICVREDHSDANDVINTIIAIYLSKPDKETILISGHDFYSNPRISPDKKQLCWICWEHPNMPWDNTELYLGEISEEGSLQKIRLIAGDEEAVCQPVWSPDNQLYYVTDRNNWWNIYRYNLKGQECILEMEAEFAVPQWSFKETNYCFFDNKSILSIYRENGLAYLGKLEIDKKTIQVIQLPYTDLESIVSSKNKIYCLAGSPDCFPEIIEYDLTEESIHVFKKANQLDLDIENISTGKTLTFPVNDNDVAYAFFYPPKNKLFTGPENELPPLIVMSHGGPTGETHNGLKMTIQFFTSRGFAVIDVNYGGSSGYGREYRQRLYKSWGIVDVNDCAKAALFVAEKGWVDKERLAIRGGSAGGFTTLAALVFTDVFKAGASHYGVCDLEALAKETHKFESRYLDRLIGPYPDEKETYQVRSPLYSVDKLSCPVIFFQGLEDKIVLPNQAEMMVEALKKNNIPVAYLAYEGEQHGFRQSKNIKRTLEAEYYFYSSIFNFECSDKVEPVEFL